MKARIKETGEIVEVIAIDGDWLFCSDGVHYGIESLEGIESEIDYWTRLEHQYAGMAMQEILRGCGDYYELTKLASCAHEHRAESIAEVSRIYAHALVEKYKKEDLK